MKKILISLLATMLMLSIESFAQQKDFEGVIFYKTEVKSKIETVSDKLMKTMLAEGDNITTYIKQGNYRQVSSACDLYYIQKNQRAYYKFRNIDTLYYLDYTSDTSTVLNISKSKEEQTIAGFSCNSISLQTASGTTKYYYSTQLYSNPEYDKNNKIGNFDVYTKETSSIWLMFDGQTKNYSLKHSATSVEHKSIEESIFELPKLPEKLLTAATLIKYPVFPRNGGWAKYLQTNVNTSIGAKYIKIPKGQSETRQTAKISFTISEKGLVENVKLINPDEVHTKVGEEAIRVVTESGTWKPANMYGEKISYNLIQPITFPVIK